MAFYNNWFNKRSIKFSKRFGNIFASLFGSVDIYDDNLSTYLIQGYQQNDVVYSVVNHISKGVGKAKWYLRDSITKEKLDIRHFELVKRKAAPQKTLSEVFQDGATQKLLTGSAYYTGERGGGVNRKYFSNIYVIPSENMQIKGSIKGITGYYPNIATGFEGTIPASDVLHLKTINPVFNSNETTEWLYGQSPLRAARLSIQTYNNSKDAGLYFLKNKGAQKAILLDENADLTAKEEDGFKNRLRSNTQGEKNTANITVLNGVKSVVDLSADPKKALVIEQRLQAAQEICNVYNFPSELIGLKVNTYQSGVAAKKAMWENCIIPELDEIVEGFNRWAILNYGENVELYYDLNHIDALQEDKLTRGKSIQSFASMVTINEAREFAGLKQFDWMIPPTTMEEFNEQVYVGFTQAVIDKEDEPSEETNTETNGA